MKSLFLSIVAWLFMVTAFSQQITGIEYYFGQDPGAGQGTNVSASANADDVNFQVDIDMSNLSQGFHSVTFRPRDDQGNYGISLTRRFYVVGLASIGAAPQLTGFEYFIDNDPGLGNGTFISKTNANELNETLSIPIGSLSAGFHAIGLRTKDVSGNWSIADVRKFYVIPAANMQPAANIKNIEYFFDQDPGVGNGTVIVNNLDGADITEDIVIDVTGKAIGTHTVYIRVIDADGNGSIYQEAEFEVRALGTNASLSEITLDAGTLDPVFDAATLSYDVVLPYGTTSVLLGATATDANVSLTGTGTIAIEHQVAKPVDIEVTAEDGTTKQTYTVTFITEKNDDASLSGITVDAGALDPVFDAATLSYDVVLPYGTTSVLLGATASDANANISGTGTIAIEHQVAKPVNIEVTAEDGTTKQTYTVTFITEKNDDASLSGITVDAGTLDQVFDAATLSYDVVLPYGTTSVLLGATASDANASLTGTGTITIEHQVAKPVNIEVTAEDGTTRQTYTVTFITEKNDDASLSGITVDVGTLDPVFDPATLSYDVVLPYGTTDVTLGATPNDANASLTGTGNVAVTAGSVTTRNIVVTAEDQTTMTTYEINFTVQNFYFVLHSNGVTVQCVGCQSGDQGELNGVTYEAVDRTLLEQRLFTDGADASTLCTSLITSMNGLFEDKTTFNQDISSWDMSNVTDMGSMFARASAFNQPVNDWDVSNVTDMSGVFYETNFNRPLNKWNVSKVTNMRLMFGYNQAFNQDISNWDVRQVVNMEGMFIDNKAFNQNLGSWDVSSATDMDWMFDGATLFSQSLVNWCVSNFITPPSNFASRSGMTSAQLPLWGFCPVNAVKWENMQWSNQTGPSLTDEVIIMSDYSGGFECKDLLIMENQTLSVSSCLDVKGRLINQGNLTVESGAALLTYDGHEISGDVLIKRNTRYADGKYSFVGSPVQQDAAITGAGLGTWVYSYNESTPYGEDGLARWEDALAEILMPGKGYAQAGQQEISFTGKPNVGTVTVSGSYTDNTDANDGWNLIANPYTAAISYVAFMADNTNNNGSIYIWDDNGSDQVRGTNNDYVVANASGAISTTPAAGQTRYNGYIGSAQAFFIKIDGQGNNDIVFEEDQRVPDNNGDDHFFRTAETIARARINLTNQDGLFKQTLVAWNEQVSDLQINRMYDAEVFNQHMDYGIYTYKLGVALAIQTISTQVQSVPLGLNLETAGTYTISLDDTEFDGELYIQDLETGAHHSLNAGAYTFTTSGGRLSERFVLRMAPETILGEQPVTSWHAYIKEGWLQFHTNHSEAVRHFRLISLTGKELLQISTADHAEVDVRFILPGVYLLTDGAQSQKIIIH